MSCRPMDVTAELGSTPIALFFGREERRSRPAPDGAGRVQPIRMPHWQARARRQGHEIEPVFFVPTPPRYGL